MKICPRRTAALSPSSAFTKFSPAAATQALGARYVLGLGLLLLAASLLNVRVAAQTASASPSATSSATSSAIDTVPAIMVSDIHFEPFADPAKVKQLAEVPNSQWAAILSAPASLTLAADSVALQQKCPVRGVDTPYPLLQSSLQAMHARQPDAQFVTVTGDLISHSFSCKYTALFPGATPADYQAFVLKTVTFVTDGLRAAFPAVPVYIALGNNDTACGDYQLDASSDFLLQAGKIIASALPAAQQSAVQTEFAIGGNYALTMAAPMRNTRLIVLNDLLLSPRYKTCASKADPAPALAELSWLQQQLAQARQLQQNVWVMGHIPPGVNPYSTLTHNKDICGSESPDMFLSSESLSDLLIGYGDVIRLALFAHTHMDEMRLLQPEPAASPAAATATPSQSAALLGASSLQSVAVKMVPSISPVNGNNPAFTVARVNPSTALLVDYEVFAASNKTGVGTTWTSEYDYAQSYHEPQYSAATLKDLIATFAADPTAATPASQSFIRNYYVGDRSAELKPFWRQYVCSMTNHTAKDFAACVCAGTK